MDVVHSAGILHRDLKPTNVLMASNGTPIVTDFGLAKWIGSQSGTTTENALLGTPSYMAPEQATGGAAAAAPTADVYSLGAILYELLTGRPPFAEATLLETLTAIIEREAISPRKLVHSIPRDLETIVLRAIAKRPANRYATAAALAEDLRRFLANQTIQARRVSWLERSWRWGRRNPASALMLAALLAAVAIGLSGITWQWRDAVAARIATEAERGKAVRAHAAEQTARLQAESRAEQLRTENDRLRQASLLIEQGRRKAEIRHWDDVVAAYTAAIKLRPDMADPIEERGSQYVKLQLFESAAEDIRHAFELRKPFNSPDWRRHALLRLHVGDSAGYQQTCRQMHAAFAAIGFPDLLLDLVRTCSIAPDSSIDPAATTTLAETVLERFYTQPMLNAVGLARYRSGDFEQAIAACRESIAMGGELHEFTYPVLSMAQFRLGRFDDSRESLRLASQAFSEWVGEMCRTSDENWTIHQGAMTNWPIDTLDWLEFLLTYYEARDLLGEIPVAEPRLLVVRARAYAGLRRLAESIAEYRKALKLAPNDTRIQLELSRVTAFQYIKHRRFELAAEEYAKAIERLPGNADLWRYSTIACLSSGNFSTYQATCREFMRRFADTKSADEAVAVVEVCVCRHDALQDWHQLLPLAHVAAGHYPDSIRYLAAAQFRAGDNITAVKTFAKLETYFRLRAADLFTLALAQHALADHDEARRRFDQAVGWIEEADRHLLSVPTTQNGATWGAWTERQETRFLHQEAQRLLDP